MPFWGSATSRITLRHHSIAFANKSVCNGINGKFFTFPRVDCRPCCSSFDRYFNEGYR